MTRYTVSCDTYTKGEGRTVTVFMCLADDAEQALYYFEKNVNNGMWLSVDAIVVEGFDFDCGPSQLLISPELRDQLNNKRDKYFIAQIHFDCH